MKDDSGSHAVFTEQGSTASQMTAAKVMDIISRLLGCAGQAAGQSGRCSNITEKFQIRNVQTHGYVYHHTNGQNHGPVCKTQSFFLNEICMVIFGRTIMVKQFAKVLLKYGWEKVSN